MPRAVSPDQQSFRAELDRVRNPSMYTHYEETLELDFPSSATAPYAAVYESDSGGSSSLSSPTSSFDPARPFLVDDTAWQLSMHEKEDSDQQLFSVGGGVGKTGPKGGGRCTVWGRRKEGQGVWLGRKLLAEKDVEMAGGRHCQCTAFERRMLLGSWIAVFLLISLTVWFISRETA